MLIAQCLAHSRQAIKKYIQSNFKDLKNFDTQFNAALRRGVDKGDFTQPKGPSGTVKLNNNKKETTKAKPAVKTGDAAEKPKKAPKAAAPKKKDAGEKEAKPKKAAPKKDAAPKKATKEKAVAKPKAPPPKKAKKAPAVCSTFFFLSFFVLVY